MAKTKLTYEDLITKLRNSHFYPRIVSTGPESKKKITELEIECSPITMDDKKARLEEVLKDWPVKIYCNTNHQYLGIKIIP